MPPSTAPSTAVEMPFDSAAAGTPPVDDVGLGGAEVEEEVKDPPEEDGAEAVEDVMDPEVIEGEGVAEEGADAVLDTPVAVLGGGVKPPYVHAPSVPKSTYKKSIVSMELN